MAPFKIQVVGTTANKIGEFAKSPVLIGRPAITKKMITIHETNEVVQSRSAKQARVSTTEEKTSTKAV